MLGCARYRLRVRCLSKIWYILAYILRNCIVLIRSSITTTILNKATRILNAILAINTLQYNLEKSFSLHI
jgi:hypothetical protein